MPNNKRRFRKKDKVVVVMGSTSDMKVMTGAVQILKELGIDHTIEIVSAHRTPELLQASVETWQNQGIQVIIAGAGGAAHLPGMLAAHSFVIPVIGVPVNTTKLHGLDALLSVVQMPQGVPVASVAIDGAVNAGLLAAQIIASSNKEEALSTRLRRFRNKQKRKVAHMRKEVRRSRRH